MSWNISVVSFIVPCPDVGHCFPGVNCILNNVSIPYITCGECPNGYLGDGIKCQAQCTNCDVTSEVCLSPSICQSKKFNKNMSKIVIGAIC